MLEVTNKKIFIILCSNDQEVSGSNPTIGVVLCSGCSAFPFVCLI